MTAIAEARKDRMSALQSVNEMQQTCELLRRSLKESEADSAAAHEQVKSLTARFRSTTLQDTGSIHPTPGVIDPGHHVDQVPDLDR